MSDQDGMATEIKPVTAPEGEPREAMERGANVEGEGRIA